MAKRCDMDPNELVVSFGDAHIYLNHLRQVREQLDREPFPSPSLTVSDAVCDKDWSELDVVDFSVDDYESHPSIRAPMAV
jgi:thymidylate synthase